MTLLFKKDDPFEKVNYRPVSLLSHVSKLFKRIILNQISAYFKSFVSNLLGGFRKSSNTQLHNLFDHIQFLKQGTKSKDSIVKLILENYRQTADCKSQIKETTLINMQTTLIEIEMTL